MKTKHPHIANIPSLLFAVLSLAAGAAAAQTSVYYTSGSGATPPGGATLGGTLASIGYDSYQSNNFGGANSDGGAISTAENSFGEEFWSNFTISGLPGTSGGGSLTSVTFYLFGEDAIPAGGSQTINIFDGLSGTGANVGSFSINDTSLPNFFSFTVSAATLTGGFSFDSTVLDGLLNVSTEENANAMQTPMIVANYAAVPEPSAALLGVVGALGFLRRRRA